MPQLDVTSYPAQLVWLFVVFLAFFCVVRGAIVPRIAKTLKDREDSLSAVLTEARSLQQEAQQKERGAEEALQATKQEVHQALSQELAHLQEQLSAKEEELRKRYADKRKESFHVMESAEEEALVRAQLSVKELGQAAFERLAEGARRGKRAASSESQEDPC
ncbi:MAG: hypothetical protein LBJ70_02630 [Holosporales bacterium]|jgi:F-type H+-transporting ATPase subunit b|nr:hypothetical protein [Holosporales bacterium]